MSKETMVFILGALVFFSPYLGLPREYKEWMLIITGALLMVIGYRLRRLAFLRSLDDGTGGKKADLFMESSAISRVEKEPSSKQDLHI